jgi:hypothetical protein
VHAADTADDVGAAAAAVAEAARAEEANNIGNCSKFLTVSMYCNHLCRLVSEIIRVA